MKLAEFVKDTHRLVDAFEKFWTEQSKVNPKMYEPDPDFEVGDWDEQFIIFAESRDEAAMEAKS